MFGFERRLPLDGTNVRDHGRPYLSGFTIVRDAVRLGYPILEAIVSALPNCDEFVVSEGYSTDATWDALCALRARFPHKIRLFRDEWPAAPNDARVLATMSNRALKRCCGRYCFYVQANEVLHESVGTDLRALPGSLPNVPLIRLPYYNIMGGRMVYLVDHRRRLFKNAQRIKVLTDGYDAGYAPESGLLGRWWDFAGRTDRPREAYCYLAHPIYRYRAMFPKNYVRKVETRLSMHKRPDLRRAWQREFDVATDVLHACEAGGQSTATFWMRMRPFFEEVLADVAIHPTLSSRARAGGVRLLDVQPRNVEHLLGKWEYDLEDSLAFLDRCAESA